MKANNENFERAQKILFAAAIIALGRRALRSYKSEGDLFFDIAIFGEKTKSILFSLLDDTRERSAKLGGKILLNASDELDSILPDEEIQLSDETLNILEQAVDDPEGWSGSKKLD